MAADDSQYGAIDIRVWDGVSDRGNCTVRWRGDRIEDVVPGGDERSPELSLIPGLVDTHVHLVGRANAVGNPRGDDTSVWPMLTTREEHVLHAAANAQRAMRHGVTTMRDLAADEVQVALSRVFDSSVLTGPRVRASGPVGMTAGHHDLFVPPAHPLRGPTADSPDECRKLVRTWAQKGLTGIKIFTSGGVLSARDNVHWRNHTEAEVEATVDEAHALGMRVAAHAHTPAGIQKALDAGVDSIEHATEMTEEQAEAIAAAGIAIGPTLLINDIIAGGRAPVGEESRAKAMRLVPSRDAGFRWAAKAGVRFVLATDASGYFLAFGDQMAETVRMAEVLELDAENALRAATATAGASLGLTDLAGRVTAGSYADFVVLEGRPWERIDELSTDRIRAVVCRGTVVAGELPVP
ncbi:MAG: amidohydrolase family protein [Streptosporangiales bacterium]|nr:amidohydrolase family protein [Streptosporangiales bacterium]